MPHLVADLGNSRLKWGRLDEAGRLVDVRALVFDDPCTWDDAWDDFCPCDPEELQWTVASVNRPVMARFRAFLERRGVGQTTFLTSASDVQVRHALARPDSTGVDRALAVLAALAAHPVGGPGQVVCCGTAITVETIDDHGIWRGGAIAAGLNMMARALGERTDQLPQITPVSSPPPSGDSTRPAMEAGIYWGAVGIARELLTRQAEESEGTPWIVFCGGDAVTIAAGLGDSRIEVAPDLVLEGLAILARGARP
ncbi:type III pantothenate kinase [Isosphaeraceae bacterium EP7]